jgi:acetyl-CoA carboxylase carboxyl transferase subunit beta
MPWFRRSKENITSEGPKKDIPDGQWTKCDGCGEMVHKKQLEQNFFTCQKCGYHFRIGSKEYFEILLDEKTFKEIDTKIRSIDPLTFVDTKKYSDRLKESMRKSGLNEAVRTGTLKKKDPLIIISSSGGARMMEAAYSLMQLAKTSAKLAQLSDAGIPYISVMTDPTTGGVTASYAMLGDVHIAEQGALIGFAGPRVIKQTIGRDLPKGFQRAEFLQEKGFVDVVLHRKELKETISKILKLLHD